MVASGLVLVAIVIWLRNTTGKASAGGDQARAGVRAVEPKKPRPGPDPAKLAQAAKSAGETAPAGPAASHAVILGEIEDASVTYDAKALPRIEPYLLHADPEIREAAKNGMINLGDAAAGPMLRKASQNAPTPQEAVALLEAANFVELPSGSVILKKRDKPAKAAPPGKPARPDAKSPAPAQSPP